MTDYEGIVRYSNLGPDDLYIYCADFPDYPKSSDEEKHNFPHPTAIPPQPSRLGDVIFVVACIGLLLLSLFISIFTYK